MKKKQKKTGELENHLKAAVSHIKRWFRQALVTTAAAPRGPGIRGRGVQGVGCGTGRRVLYLSLNLGFLIKTVTG